MEGRPMMLTEEDRKKLTDLLQELGDMPGFVRATLGGLPPAAATRPGPDRSFSPVEHCWHLADLEREGFGRRIHRLLTEDDPELPDFDGGRVAEERNYGRLSLEEGIEAFAQARAENVAALREVSGAEWTRVGTQAGVGRVALCDVPALMAQHDASHRQEIEAWVTAYTASHSR